MPYCLAAKRTVAELNCERLYPVCVSTRLLIILALVCGLAILVAFAVQAAQLI